MNVPENAKTDVVKHWFRQAKTLASLFAVFSSSGCKDWPNLHNDSALEDERPYDLEVLAMENCPLPEHLNPKNVALLSYRIKLQGNHSSRIPANYFYAALVTTDGKRYLSTYYGCQPLLSGAPLQKGETKEGFVNFSIPPSKVPEKLVYSPEVISLSAQSALVEVPVNPSSFDAKQHEEEP